MVFTILTPALYITFYSSAYLGFIGVLMAFRSTFISADIDPPVMKVLIIIGLSVTGMILSSLFLWIHNKRHP